MIERRRHSRFSAVFGSDIDPGQADHKLGLTQDVSRGGARLLTFSPFGLGKNLKMRIVIEDGEETSLSAAVVREKNINAQGTWKYEIAVRFDTLLPEQVLSHMLRIQDERKV